MIRVNRDRLRGHPHGEAQLEILESALAAINPSALIDNHLSVAGDTLQFGQREFSLTGRRIWILSIGKASVPMARAIERCLGPERLSGGVAVTRTGYGGPTECVHVIEAGHPLPDGTDGADAVMAIADQVGPDDLVLCLLSGGGSALLASPPPGIHLSDLAHTTELLLHSGVTIETCRSITGGAADGHASSGGRGYTHPV